MERLNRDDFPDSPSCHWELENYWWSDLESDWYKDSRMHDQAVFRLGFETGERYVWKLIRPQAKRHSVPKENCCHPSLPKRTIGEIYSDTCPDCGYRQYCFCL